MSKIITSSIFFLILNVIRDCNSSGLTECDEEWVRHGKKCYRLYEHHVSFAEAIDACTNEYMGELATMTSREEQYFIRDEIFGDRRLYSFVWLAGFRSSSSNHDDTFYWLGGQKMNFTAWMSGEPNNLHNTEYCVAMLGRGPDPELWIDNRCDDLCWALCQKHLHREGGLPAEKDQAPARELAFQEEELLGEESLVWIQVAKRKSLIFALASFSLFVVTLIVIMYRLGNYNYVRAIISSQSSSFFGRFYNENNSNDRRG